MNLAADRVKWNLNSGPVKELIDSTVMKLKADGTEPVDYMVVDMVFRQYLHWMQGAYNEKIPADRVRATTIHLLKMIILEIGTRVSSLGEDGRPMPLLECVREFMTDTGLALVQEIKFMEADQQGSPQGHA